MVILVKNENKNALKASYRAFSVGDLFSVVVDAYLFKVAVSIRTAQRAS